MDKNKQFQSNKNPVEKPSSILKATQMKPELLKNGYEIKDQNLSDFTKSFCDRIIESSPKRETFDREKLHRRMDGFARLLVGNETCSALAFDGKDLLIATNENKHSENKIYYEIRFNLKQTSFYDYTIEPIILFSYNNSAEVRLTGSVLKALYIPKDGILDIAGEHKQNIVIKASQHLIDSVPDISINISISKSIPFFSQLAIPSSGLDLHTQLKVFKPLDAVRSRAETLVQHLTLIALIAEKSDSISAATMKQYKNVIDQYREKILKESLSWESSKWYKDIKVKDYNNAQGKNKIDQFVEELNKHFNLFKECRSLEKVTKLVGEWEEVILHDAEEKKFHIPSFIEKSDKGFKEFIRRAKQYFVDLVKLEKFFQEKHELSKLFLTHRKLDSSPPFLKIVDDLEDKVHAEIKILNYFNKKNTKPEYIATSILCCPHCKLVMDAHGIHDISGVHGNATNWILPDILAKDDEFIKNFLGEETYKIFSKFKEENYEFDHKNMKKGDFALKIACSISSLITSFESKEVPLKALKIPVDKLSTGGSQLADESDCEYEPETPTYKFLYDENQDFA